MSQQSQDRSRYDRAALRASKAVTHTYSTSFGWAIRLFPQSIREPIYAIYGFVRVADEMVDTFPAAASVQLLKSMRTEYHQAVRRGYSENLIVHAFAQTAKEYDIGSDLVDAFLDSMEMDTELSVHTNKSYKTYIYGSAEVVGLMCLKIFCGNNHRQYRELEPGAQALGSAFQKVNFLRDFGSDYRDRGRVYFPGVKYTAFSNELKRLIEADILKDFQAAEPAISQLPASARPSVMVAYCYYFELLKRIQRNGVAQLKQQRIRISNFHKIFILLRVWLVHVVLRRPMKIVVGDDLPKAV